MRDVSSATGDDVRGGLVACSPAMRRVADRIGLLADSDAPVIVVGERGAGKEWVARAIHAQGARRHGPFRLLDATFLRETMFAAEWSDLGKEGELRDGWFREAAGGTLVVDGVDRLSRVAQAHLIRVIDEPGAPATGTAEGHPRGVRLIALTRECLADRVVAGEFLESLYYRLDGAQVRVPALRERLLDLRPLVADLLRELGAPASSLRRIPAAAWGALEHHGFPGNVGELRAMLELALARAGDGPLDMRELPSAVAGPRAQSL